MSLAKKLVYFIILLLCLEAVKRILDKLAFDWSILVVSILSSIQFFAILFFIFKIVVARFFSPRKRKWGVVISFLVLISLAEGLFAWLLSHGAAIPTFMEESFGNYYYNYELSTPRYHRELSEYNPQLFYTFKPGLSAPFRTKEFNTVISANKMGLRDDDASLQQPAIICLGDSYCMGWGVGQQETYAQRLEQLSGKKVLNAGIASYGTVREMIMLGQLDTTALTHIVIQYCSNDYLENKTYLDSNYHLPISSRGAFDSLVNETRYSNYYYPGKYFSVITKIFCKLQVNKVVSIFNMTHAKQPKMNEKEHARAFMEVLDHAAFNLNNVRVIVCVTGDTQDFGKEFLQQAKSYKNLAIVDLSTTLEPKDWYTMDLHLKPSGHEKIAQKIWELVGRP